MTSNKLGFIKLFPSSYRSVPDSVVVAVEEVAHTIAEQGRSEQIQPEHLAEAIQYRS